MTMLLSLLNSLKYLLEVVGNDGAGEDRSFERSEYVWRQISMLTHLFASHHSGKLQERFLNENIAVSDSSGTR
jgi:hypothetical protein